MDKILIKKLRDELKSGVYWSRYEEIEKQITDEVSDEICKKCVVLDVCSNVGNPIPCKIRLGKKSYTTVGVGCFSNQ